MKIPHLGLFGRLLLLFSITTVIVSACIALGYFVISEAEAKRFISERQTQLFQMVKDIADKPVDIEKLNQDAKNNRVSIMVKRGEQLYATTKNFPNSAVLLAAAEPIGPLLFSKVGSKYYLHASIADSHIAVTSNIANLIVYPQWLILWPWILAMLVLIASYYVLKTLLDPINQAIDSARRISSGDLGYRITQHPKTELARLTHSLNKMAEDLQKLFAAKNDMLMAISHELRTPLGRMKVSLALLDNNDISTDLNNDINYMNNLIGQLLEGERLEQGARVLNITNCYLPMLIEDVLSENGFSEQVVITTDLPEIAVKLDTGRIKFVLRNLLQNAIEHGNTSEKVQLAVTLTEQALILSVTDQGQGIPQHRLHSLFTPFFNAADIQHRNSKGVGLALYLCKRIAQAHDGQLSVVNLSPQGCQFSLALPILSVV
ncbi:MAG: HAMP domain-containing histidine kinase [Gammaproteobacteria bacterium]|nr:HAMP domain-containing histidine kinase [Gammaproteobacteria bacterium]MBU1553628.1 HAMP domain-containing histidine kinase [Gammaproteobacteria bacterium]MBU2069275.1 HAMP domain-containing histidine kinase [Gammaproteobacteria bacterium]MBU2183270.1 HAMP domain-containing histidine kinase [Gammaproteobacteria bacterium]MBU2204485.1 HAMP domain-containing histidine kinase [Gammaproteobacteria bacterium]